MKIENIKEFTKRIKKSKSTVYRFYENNRDLWDVTIKKSNKRYFPVEHAKYFDSILMYEENKKLVQENKSMRNLIDCLVDKDSLAYRLWYMDWSLFITVAYKNEKRKNACYNIMTKYYDDLIEKHGDKTEIRMFFTTEPFANRDGYHNHFVLFVSDDKLLKQIRDELKNSFNGDRVDAETYNKFEAGVFYTVKHGLLGEDWDILGNQLSNDIKGKTSTI